MVVQFIAIAGTLTMLAATTASAMVLDTLEVTEGEVLAEPITAAPASDVTREANRVPGFSEPQVVSDTIQQEYGAQNERSSDTAGAPTEAVETAPATGAEAAPMPETDSAYR
jgi:hypothetical protein